MAAVTSFLARRLHRLMMRRVVIGYPRSGNTWFSALCRHVIIDAYGLPAETMPKLFLTDGLSWGTPFKLFTVPFGILGTYLTHGYRTNPLDPTLDPMRAFVELAKDAKTVILMRDPKDVITSYYLRRFYRKGQVGVGTIEEFVRDPLYGIERYIAYYNLLAEVRRRSKQPTLIVRYEEMWADTAETLRRSAEFLGLKGVTDAHIAKAVEACSLENMKQMEQASTRDSTKVPNLFRVSSDRAEARQVRKGGLGNWREHLSEETAAWIDRCVEQRLDGFYRSPLAAEAAGTQAA